MEAGDVGARDLGHLQPAQCRDDEELKVAPVFFRRPRLQTDRDVLLVEPFGEVGDGGYLAAALSAGCRVFAIPDARQNVDCARSGLLGRGDTVVTENHAPTVTAGAVHHDVSPRAPTHDADAETRDLAVSMV